MRAQLRMPGSRVDLHEQARPGRCVLGEGSDHRVDRRLQVEERRVGAQLEVVLHLQRQHVIGRAGLAQAAHQGVDPRTGALGAHHVQGGAEIDQGVVMHLMRLVAGIEPPEPVAHQVVGHVPHRLEPEAVAVARHQVGLGRLGGQRQHGLRILREAAVARHAVALQRDPVRTQVAEIRHRDVQAAGLGGGDRDLVVVALLAEQHQVGHALAVDQIGDEGRPGLAGAAEIDAVGPAPEHPVAKAEIHPQAAVTPRLQRIGDPGEERRDRALEEQEDLTPASAGFLAGVLMARVSVMGVSAARFDVSRGISSHGHTSALGGIRRPRAACRWSP